MSQPEWKLLANLGDASPTEYGAYLIFTDETGAYPPEAELWEEPCDDAPPGAPWTVYRWILERCTYSDGILSENKFHPNLRAWFAGPGDLASVASTADTSDLELIRQLCSEDPLDRANAYRDLVGHFGAFEFDQYPETYSQAEIEARWESLQGKAQP